MTYTKEQRSKYNKEQREKRKILGRCVDCSNSTFEGHIRCKKHIEENRIYSKNAHKKAYYADIEKARTRGRSLAIYYLHKITDEQYNEMFKKQKGKCRICKQLSSKTLSIDHNHETGKIRGLLCENCNRELSMFQDSTSFLQEAIKYLEDTSE